MKPKYIWLSLAVLMLVVSALYIRSFRFQYQKRHTVGEIDKNVFRKLRYPFKVNNFKVASKDSTALDESFFIDQWTFLYLGSSQTKDRTAPALQKFQQVFELLKKQNVSLKNIQGALLTVTPQIDTPIELQSLLNSTPNIKGLQPLRNDHISISALVNAPTSVTDKGIFHPLNLYLVGPDKTMLGYFSYPFDPKHVVLNFLKIQNCGVSLCK